MRIALSALVVTLAANLNCVAKDLTDWAAVQKLKPGTEVLVVDGFNNRADGYVTSVSLDELKLDVQVSGQPGLLAPEVLARTNVHEVYKVGKKFERRLGATNLALSSAIGLAGGIALGAVVDQEHPSTEDPGQGKLLGGVLGFFAGPAVLAAGRSVISSLHKTKVIYRAPVPHPPRAFRGVCDSAASKVVDHPQSELLFHSETGKIKKHGTIHPALCN